jgi:putative phosphoribosyl transferase
MGNSATPRALSARETSVTVPAGSVTLDGTLAVPDSATGIVLFAHGSGSSRHSPRNRYVAEELRFAGFGTMLLDLLTTAEEAIDDRTRELRFDIEFLAERLLAAVRWVSTESATRALPLGLFGASTGAGLT